MNTILSTPSLVYPRYPFCQRSFNARTMVRASSLASKFGEKEDGVGSVAIVGGGLGGLAAAIALKRRGIDVQVYEKNPTISGGEGTMISLFPNGVWALSQSEQSLVAQLKESGVCDPTCLNHTPDGTLVGQWDIAPRMERTYGFPMVAIRWRRVLDVLAHQLPPDCIHTDHELLDLKQDEDYATAVFKTPLATKEVKAKLVVGADGVRSKVRSVVFGEQEPRDNGRAVWRAIIPFDTVSHPLIKAGHVTATVGEGRTTTISDAGHNSLYWAYTVTDTYRGKLAGVRSKDGAEAKERLRADFQDWDLALHILEATEADSILERRVLDLPVLPEWAKNRVVLLGDAAHALTPALGQGANLAFEDGLELAEQLAASPSLEAALAEYQRIRIPRVQAIATQNAGGSVKIVKEGSTEPMSFYDYMYGYRGDGKFEESTNAVAAWMGQAERAK